MALFIVYLVILGFFLRGDKFTPGGVARRRDQAAPNVSDPVASPPISEPSAKVWRWDRMESIGTFASKTRGGPVAQRAVAPAVPLAWTALDDHQLNRLLKESWTRTD